MIIPLSVASFALSQRIIQKQPAGTFLPASRMFHVEQFMIPNVKQLLPKLRRNVITSTISLLVPRSKCFTWNKHPISIPCKTPVRQLRNNDNSSITTPFTHYKKLLPNLSTRLENNKNKPHRSSSGRFNVFTVMNVIHFQTTWNKIKNVSRGT